MKRSLFILAPLFFTLGCGAPLSLVASHTIQTAPDTDQDVVWVLASGSLQRCTAVKNEPVCKRVPVER